MGVSQVRMRIKGRIDRALGWLLALAPILSIYKTGVGEINVGDIALIGIILMSLCAWSRGSRTVGRCRFAGYFCPFFAIAFIQLIARGQGSFGHFWPNWLRIVTLVYLVDIAARSDISGDALRDALIWLGTGLSLLLLAQAAADRILGIPLFPYLRNIPLNYEVGAVELIARQLRWRGMGAWRYSSIFPEPAHFAQYALLSLAAAVFGGERLLQDRRRTLCAAIITLAIFLSQSANGVLLVIPLWGIFLLQSLRGARRANVLIGFGVALIACMVLLARLSNVIDSALDHVRSAAETGYATTGNLRLLQGLAVFRQLGPLEKLIGVGYGNLRSYLTDNWIRTAYNSTVGSEYMNGFSTVLVCSGWIGLLLYLWVWTRLYFENGALMNRVALMLLSALFCTSNMFYSELTVTYLVFVRCAGMDVSGRRCDDG